MMHKKMHIIYVCNDNNIIITYITCPYITRIKITIHMTKVTFRVSMKAYNNLSPGADTRGPQGGGAIAPPPGEFQKEKPTGKNIGKSLITDNHFHLILLV